MDIAGPGGIGAGNPSNPQSWNRYAYVNNGPLNHTDPQGLDDWGGWGGGWGDGGWGDIWSEQLPIYTGPALDPSWIIWNYHRDDQTGFTVGDYPGEPNCSPENGDQACTVWDAIQQMWDNPCSVTVSCDAPAKAPAAAHCGLTTGQDGSYTQYDGMPSSDSLFQIANPFSNQPKLVVQVLPNSPPPGGPHGGNVIFQSPVSCSQVGCIQTVTSYFNSAQWAYSAPFLNSNTYAAAATRACGLAVNYPWNAIGTH